VAVASAGPYANTLHLAPGIQPCQHLITQFLQASCNSWHPTNSVKAVKANENRQVMREKKLETEQQYYYTIQTKGA